MRLTTQDASFLYAETASGPMHGAGILVLEGEASFDEIYRHIESRLHLIPRYRQRLAFVPFNLAHAKWIDDPDFKLDNHVKQYPLPPGTTLKRGLEIALELNQPLLDRTRPLWTFHVLEGVPGHTLLLQNAHHAMIDGVSGVDLSMVLLDLDPNAPPPPPPETPWSPDPMPTPFELMNEAITENLRSFAVPSAFPQVARDTERTELLQRATEVMTRLLAEPIILAPWNAGLVGPKRRLAWTKHNFAEFREIRRAFGGTINDIVLAVVSESAARYLKIHDENVEGQYLRIMCPVSVRREDERGALGNRVSGIFPRLPAWPMDIAERLEFVRLQTEGIKANREAQALQVLQESVPELSPLAMAPSVLVGSPMDPTVPAAQFPFPVFPRMGPRPPFFGFNFTCTNVPGVQVPQYIAGHKVLYTVMAIMLGGTLGYGVAVGSYNKELVFNFMGEPRLLGDVELMRLGVDEAFAELLEAAEKQAGAPAGA